MCPSKEEKKQKHFLLPNMESKATHEYKKSRTCLTMFKGMR